MDLEHTDDLFNSAIQRSGSHSKENYTEEDIKKQRLVVGFGNLHNRLSFSMLVFCAVE